MSVLVLKTISILKRSRIIRLLFISFLLLNLLLLNAFAQERQMSNDNSSINSPFGVLEFLSWRHPWNNFKYSKKEDLIRVVELMKEAGVGFVRMDFLWEDLEPEPGKFNFENYDYIVSLLDENNIKILGLLNYSTDWASSSGKWNSPPKENALFVNYATRVIERYKDKIKYWEVWNEPDSSIYWNPQDCLKGYCLLLKDVYLAAKQIDPECKILNGGIANGIASINHLYDNGAKDYFDILNIHIFENPQNINSKAAVATYPKLAYKIMSRNGDSDKKIWVTEIGCPGVKSTEKVKNWWAGVNPSEEEQAQWLKDTFNALLEDKNVQVIFWAFFRDCKKHWDNGIDYFGLVSWDFAKKPSFEAFKVCFEDWSKSR